MGSGKIATHKTHILFVHYFYATIDSESTLFILNVLS